MMEITIHLMAAQRQQMETERKERAKVERMQLEQAEMAESRRQWPVEIDWKERRELMDHGAEKNKTIKLYCNCY